MTTRLDDPQSIPQALANRLLEARRLAVVTGAGVSAESGIPTFRDAQTGLWARFDPMALASPEGFERDPRTVWQWYRWRRELITRARPNAGHFALVEMEPLFDRLTVVTQNVDGFHALAGSSDVLELHGNIQRNVCSRTGRPIDASWLDQHADSEPPPSPHDPRGLARPDVVWFGESLDGGTLEAAFAAAEECEIMIIAGTHGAVQPAASVPVAAARAGATVLDVNPESSELTRIADWHLAGSSAAWLPALLEAVRAGRERAGIPARRL
jgi:NAD-dependent deacetylase